LLTDTYTSPLRARRGAAKRGRLGTAAQHPSRAWASWLAASFRGQWDPTL